MTEQEAIKKLDELTIDDSEMAHFQRDCILIDFLRQNGFEKLAERAEEAEQEIGFWYA